VVTKRHIIVALASLLILDTLVLAWMVWLLNHGAEADPTGAWGDYVRLAAFVSFPILAVALAVILEIHGWRRFRRRRRRQLPHVG
jgi:hypothetical protein